MRTPRSLLVVAITALAAGGTVPALAGTGTATAGDLGVTVSVPDQTVRPGCAGYPVSHTVAVPVGAAWRLTTRLQGPRTASATATGTDDATGSLAPALCANAAPGLYTVTGTLEDLGTLQTVTATTTFRILRTPAQVSAGVAPSRALTGATVVVSGAATALQGGSRRPVRDARITLQYRPTGSTTWVTFRRVTAAGGAYRQAWRFPATRSVHVRAGVAATATTAAASSVPALLTRVAPPVAVPLVRYPRCAVLRSRHPHGVGLSGARDRTTGTPVTTFLRHAALYRLNTHLDADRDGIACERR